MTLPTIIDVAIGLVLIFFILASLGSVLAELVAAHQKWRHKLLRRTVTMLLEPDSARKFWTHPLILPLFARTPRAIATTKAATVASAAALEFLAATDPSSASPAKPGHWTRLKRRTKAAARLFRTQVAEAPAYLDPALFAGVVLDLSTGEGACGRLPATPNAWAYAIRTYVPAKPGENNDLQDRLLALLRQVPADAADCGAALKTNIAQWYKEAMARTSGEYRRHLQKWLLIIGSLLAVGFNCDALRIATVLYQSPTLRAQVAQQAETLVQEKAPAAGQSAPVADDAGMKTQLKEDVTRLRDLTKIGFPIGWAPVWKENFILVAEGADHPGLNSYLAKMAGLFASALAVCLGAPFWFDLLSRLVKLRSSAGADAEKKKSDDSAAAGVAVAATSSGSVAVAATTGGTAVRTQPLPDALATLGDPSMAFSPARAYWLAEIAEQAYGLDLKEVTAWCRQQGFNQVQFFDDAATGTQAMLVEGPGVAVLAFRGTETRLDDWLTDAKCIFCQDADCYGDARIHAGFHVALAALWKNTTLARSLAALAGSRTLLYLAGHSLGGALATLAAYRLAKQNPQAVHSLYTYGSPRVGDPTFVREFDTLFAGRAYRVVNNEDLVTRVPPRSGGYDHIGTIIYIDDTGTIQRDIGFWYRFLNFAANAAQDFQQALKTTLHDHGLRLYCGHLEQAAKKSDRVS